MAGSRKTGVLAESYKTWTESGKKVKALALTHVARENLVNRGVEQDDSCTLNKFLGVNVDGSLDMKGGIKTYDNLIVDEDSMISRQFWRLLAKKVARNRSLIHAAGDIDQCVPPADKIKLNIYKTQFLKELLGKSGKLLKKEYHIEIDPITKQEKTTGRCDKEIRKLIHYIKTDKYHRLPQYLFTPEYDWFWVNHMTAVDDLMICSSRKKVKSISVDILNKRKNGDLKIKVGCRVICNDNCKQYEIYNGQRYVVKQLLKDKQMKVQKWEPDPSKRRPNVNEIKTVPMKHFTLANAETNYKYQGLTLWEKYTIFQPLQMSMQDMITSLTRARKLTQIRMTNKVQCRNRSAGHATKPLFYNEFEKKYFEVVEIKPVQLYNLYLLNENNGER